MLDKLSTKHYDVNACAPTVTSLALPPPLIARAVSTIVDLTLGIVVPLHAHMGVRSVLVDYVHGPTEQTMALAVLAGVTVLTALGLTKFNVTDVGLTEGVKSIFIEQPPPAHMLKTAPKQ